MCVCPVATSLTSSNYDDDEKKLTGGRNGYGAKLTNIYSHEFSAFPTCSSLVRSPLERFR